MAGVLSSHLLRGRNTDVRSHRPSKPKHFTYHERSPHHTVALVTEAPRQLSAMGLLELGALAGRAGEDEGWFCPLRLVT